MFKGFEFNEQFWIAVCFCIFLLLTTRLIFNSLKNYLANLQNTILKDFQNKEIEHGNIFDKLNHLKERNKEIPKLTQEILDDAVVGSENLVKQKEIEFNSFLERKEALYNYELNLDEQKVRKELSSIVLSNLKITITNKYLNYDEKIDSKFSQKLLALVKTD